MSKELVISRPPTHGGSRILEEGQLVEIYIEREKRVRAVVVSQRQSTRCFPASVVFVDIGLDGDAFLYVSDVFRKSEDYEHGHGMRSLTLPRRAISVTLAHRVLPGETWGTPPNRREPLHRTGQAETLHSRT